MFRATAYNLFLEFYTIYWHYRVANISFFVYYSITLIIHLQKEASYTKYLLSLFAVLGMLAFSTAAAENNIHFLFSDLSDSFAAQIHVSLESLLPGTVYSPVFMDAHGSFWTQLDQAEEAAHSGADLVCIQSCEYASLSAARNLLEPLEKAGIPVIFFGRSIAASTDRMLEFLSEHPDCLYIHHDPDDIGRTQGRAAGIYLCSHYAQCDLNHDGQISYIALQGDPYDPDAQNRTDLAVESINTILADADHSPLVWYDGSSTKALADPQCMWSADFARNTLSDVLAMHPPESGSMPELVLCGNDDMANGSINALFHVGYNTDLADSPSIPVFGVDGTLLAMELIKKGRMTGTVMRSPDNISRALLSGIQFLLAGEPLNEDTGRSVGACIFPAYAYIGNP